MRKTVKTRGRYIHVECNALTIVKSHRCRLLRKKLDLFVVFVALVAFVDVGKFSRETCLRLCQLQECTDLLTVGLRVGLDARSHVNCERADGRDRLCNILQIEAACKHDGEMVS